MEGTFRSIPLTIIDFFAAIVPGLAWLLLFATTSEMLLHPDHVTTPVEGFRLLVASVSMSNAWISPVSAMLVAFAIGHAIKPVAMPASQEVAVWLFRLKPEFRKCPISELIFPFSAIHETHKYYAHVEEHVRKVTKLHSNDLPPGRQPFSAAKRLLRLECAPLWEEAEHMEAEVRLIGGLFLSALYSGILAVGAVIRTALLGIGQWNSLLWCVTSLIAALILGESFNRARVREVGYTYLNLILAVNARAHTSEPTEKSVSVESNESY